MGIAYWNDWQNGLYYLNDTSLYSIQNILNNRINENISFLASNSTSGVKISDLPTSTIRMAIAVIGILPIVLHLPLLPGILRQRHCRWRCEGISRQNLLKEEQR